jgi:hypothetical protein
MSKPFKYSRKISKDGFICTCETMIVTKHINDEITYVVVKYEIEPPKERSKYIKSQYSGTFKKMIEMPDIFSKLDSDDYKVNVSHFMRDGWKVPYPRSIEIINIEKYEFLKLKDDRRKKLINLKNV